VTRGAGFPLLRGGEGADPARGVHVRVRALLRALVAASALILLAPSAHADPSDEYSERVAQDEDYVAGKAAIDRKAWSEAATRLSRAAVRHPDNADLHNYLGFAHRHLKQFDQAFEHYRRAIAIEPRHRGAHEYIGEAYLMVGDLPGAEKHVAALRSICLLPCEELADLEKAVAKYRASAGQAGGIVGAR
jgi:Flp pilus assembly protein TadD